MKTCLKLLTVDEKIRLFCKCQDVEVINAISSSESFVQLSDGTYSAKLNDFSLSVFGVSSNFHMGGFLKYLIPPHLQSCYYPLFNTPPYKIALLFIIEDLGKPDAYTAPFNEIAMAIVDVYHEHPDVHASIRVWLKSLSRVTLPVVKRPLLMDLLGWPMLLAAFAGDKRFFDFIQIDMDSFADWSADPEHLCTFYRDLRDYVSTDDKKSFEYQDSGIEYIEHLLQSRGSLGLLGFKAEPIRRQLVKLQYRIRTEDSQLSIQELLEPS